ncbi:MAG: DegT/DnrJ/EryC1/StrS family aminotransferase [Pseudomonadota bacterium]
MVDTLGSDWITTGPKVLQLEDEFRAFLDAPAALALYSATDAMLIALAGLDIEPGDEVISTPMTFYSNLHVIEHRGARPRLVDVEPDTLNLDPGLIEAAITPAGLDIEPVHLHGHPCDLDPIRALATRRGPAVVCDAAHALPARYQDRLIGSGDNLTEFRFRSLSE